MKWGILATGTIAKKFASTVEQMGAEGEQLVAVGSRHMESAQAFAQQYGIPRCYDSYEALAADPHPVDLQRLLQRRQNAARFGGVLRPRIAQGAHQRRVAREREDELRVLFRVVFVPRRLRCRA